jgi:hypothetical protein
MEGLLGLVMKDLLDDCRAYHLDVLPASLHICTQQTIHSKIVFPMLPPMTLVLMKAPTSTVMLVLHNHKLQFQYSVPKLL